MHQSHNTAGTIGKIEAHGGKLFVEVPEKRWEKIEEAVVKDEDLVPATVVMQELRISKKTLFNYISSGKISRKMYTIAVNGMKFFRNKLILGAK